MEPLRIISLGWGVQSFAMAAMSALGELPPVDAAIHADTTHERHETYEFAKRWTPWLEERGVRVITVRDASAARKIFERNNQAYMPAFTVKLKPAHRHENKVILWRLQRDKCGQLRRSCTQRWKIAPQRRAISTLLKEAGIAKGAWVVDQLFGITKDEWTRMKDSDVRYVTNRYPFMEEFDPPMTRADAGRWLQDRGLEIPVKSACVFCPYHNLEAWREIKNSGNGDWEKAIEADQAIRDKRPGYKCYVHPARVPLEEVDLRNAQDHGQLALWDEEECSGMCFL